MNEIKVTIDIYKTKRILEQAAYILFCVATFGLIAVLRITITKAILKADELKVRK